MWNWTTGNWTTRKRTLCWTARKMTWSRTTRKRTVIRKKQGEVGDALLAADEGTSWSVIEARPSSARLLMALWQYCVHHIFFINFPWRRFPPKRVSSYTTLVWTMFSETWFKKKERKYFIKKERGKKRAPFLICSRLFIYAVVVSLCVKLLSSGPLSVRWYLLARQRPDLLHPISQRLPQRCLWTRPVCHERCFKKAPLHTPQSELALYAWCTPSRLFNTNVQD